MLEGLNFKRQGRIVLVYPVFETLRKLCLIVTVVYLQKYPTFSIFFVNFQAQTMIMVLGLASPFSSRLAIKMGIVNEVFMLFCNYHLFMFTDFLLFADLRQYVGFCLATTLTSCVFFNLGVFSFANLYIAARKSKLLYLKTKHRNHLRKCLDRTLNHSLCKKIALDDIER